METGQQSHIQRTKDTKMKVSSKFLKLITAGEIDRSAELVLPGCTVDQRVDLILKTLKNTPMKCHRDYLAAATKTIVDYRNGTISDWDVDVMISRIKSSQVNWATENFIGILLCIMLDLRYEDWKQSAIAIHRLNGHYPNRNYAKDLLFEMAEIVWPKKGLMRAIYG